jgi:AcrR family transcriptional regulator
VHELVTLIWHAGYQAATQDQMLAATGLSSSSLYRAFGTKPEILAEALESYVADAAALLGPLEEGERGTADVRAFLDRVHEQLSGPMGVAGCLVVHTMQDPINSDPRIAALTGRYLGRMREALHTALRRAAEACEPLPAEPAALSDALRAGVLGALARARSGDVTDALALVDGLRSMVPHDPLTGR